MGNGRVVNSRFTGFGAISPGAHPEYDDQPKPASTTMKSPHSLGTALSNSFRSGVKAIKRGLGIDAPDYSGIASQIEEKKAVNRYLQQRGGKIS
jgi:hypothetical protein